MRRKEKLNIGDLDMSEINFTDQNFSQEVLKSNQPVLVDFWAPWCTPCRVQGPIIEKLSKEVVGVKVGKLNVDENGQTATQYGVMSIPTLIIFKNGQPVEQMVGVQAKDQLKKKLEAVK